MTYVGAASVNPRYSRKQAAEYLGISENTLKQWAYTKKEQIPFFKVGRKAVYLKSDLDEYLSARRVG